MRSPKDDFGIAWDWSASQFNEQRFCVDNAWFALFLWTIVVELPQEWDFHPLDGKGRKERVHLVRLGSDSPEYQYVQGNFMESLSDREVSISSIQRVQNPSMYRSYVTKKQSMDEKNGIHKNERRLFHGTGFHNVKNINAHGFNRSFCGRNGTYT